MKGTSSLRNEKKARKALSVKKARKRKGTATKNYYAEYRSSAGRYERVAALFLVVWVFASHFLVVGATRSV